MQPLEELAASWEAKAKNWKRAAAQQRGSRCHDDKARLIMKSELAAGHARELRMAMAAVEASMITAESFKSHTVEFNGTSTTGPSLHEGKTVVVEPAPVADNAALAAATDGDVQAHRRIRTTRAKPMQAESETASAAQPEANTQGSRP